MVYLLM